MAWAAAHGQGAPAAAVERAAAEFLTRADVHRAPDPSERRFTTSDLLAHEQAIVHGAQARRGEGAGRLDSRARRRGARERAVRAHGRAGGRDPRADLQRSRRRERRGAGRDGQDRSPPACLPGPTTAGGFRVLGAAPTGRAVRELTEQAGITQAWTLTRLALDLDADATRFRDRAGRVDPRRGRHGEHPRDRPRAGARSRGRGQGHRDRRLRPALQRPGRRLAGIAHPSASGPTSCAR